VFAAVHTYFAFGQPSWAARTINLSLGLLVLCFQSAWLLLRRVEAGLLPITRGVGYLLATYCLASLARTYEDTGLGLALGQRLAELHAAGSPSKATVWERGAASPSADRGLSPGR
jgi:hypothetical protein